MNAPISERRPSLPHPVLPRPALPRLSTLRQLSLSEREAALGAWVSWFNANRHLVSMNFEHQLDRALHDLQADAVPEGVLTDLDERFDAWLATAGQPGEGRGPNETLEDI